MRYSEGRMGKKLNEKILMTWKDLLKLREQQGYQNTFLKLVVKKKMTENLKEEKSKWDADLKQEINEVVEELKQKYKKECEEYKERHRIWSESKQQKV